MNVLIRGATCLWCLLLLVPWPAVAENIDPDNDDSQYVYAENVRWCNAEPLGGA